MGFLNKLFGGHDKLTVDKFYTVLVSSYKSFTLELSESPLTSQMEYNKREVLLFVATVQIATYFSFSKNLDKLIIKNFIHLVANKMSEKNEYSPNQFNEFLIHFDEVIMIYCPLIEEHFKLVMSPKPNLMHVFSLTDEFIDICLPINSSPLHKPQLIVSIGHLLNKSPRKLFT
jgi:hypothetical protein